jgi:hypothetical protein
VELENFYQLSYNILLAGSDNRLYSYYLSVHENPAAASANTPVNSATGANTPSKLSRKSSQSSMMSSPGGVSSNNLSFVEPVIVKSHYFGYFQLPGKVSTILSAAIYCQTCFYSSFSLFYNYSFKQQLPVVI